MVVSNKQRQKHINLATIWKAKFKGAHEHSKSLQPVIEPKCKPQQ